MTTTATKKSSYIPQLPKFSFTVGEIEADTTKVIESARAIYDKVAAIPVNEATFENTILPIANEKFEDPSRENIIRSLKEVHTDKNIRDACTDAEIKLDKFSIESSMREDVYKVVFSVFNNKEIMDRLSPLDRRLATKVEEDYRRNGLNLTADKREELKKVKEELAELSTKFNRNISEEDGEALFTREELAGLPDSFFDERETREVDGVTKYVVTTKYPDLYPVLKQAKVWKTRMALKEKDETRCKGNVGLIEKAIKLRHKQAQLMGYKTHAGFKLEVMMAKKPENVIHFENDLRNRLNVLADRELAEIAALKAEEFNQVNENFDGELYMWDYAYYINLIKERRFNVSDDEVKQYFSMGNVTKGILDTYQNMLGLKFVKSSETAWHRDVTVHEVWDSATGDFVGHFLMDLYPREGKYNHAACFPLRPGFERADGTREYPVAAIVANFPKPSGNTPSLLTHSDVTTYFHEFGHVMHELCSKVKYEYFHGTSVETDFVEAPSQMLENWCWEPTVLQKFAFHYKTDKPIPSDLVERLVAARNVGAGLVNLRQIFFGLFDMEIHNTENPDIDTTKLYSELREKVTRFKNGPKEVWPLATFGHMMGGYDAGYYGYMWSEVFSADMFYSRFKEEGIDNVETGRSYREEILKPGGSRDGNDMIRNFLGREPNNKAFLKSIGL
ncbi:metalloendopeptidase [Mycoemilia scoparia]|uniref:Metalloendopeptidase n=1 Tax=Mycoemilia scoparia TaxID=417184 RepID=A0A9W7ZRS1_9FUNG|nr:metalloendopeptidase [Mycoemilia scoparia]